MIDIKINKIILLIDPSIILRRGASNLIHIYHDAGNSQETLKYTRQRNSTTEQVQG